MAERSNKDLLQLETNNNASSSTSCLESKLFVCKKQLPEAPTHKPDIFSAPESQVLGKLKDFLADMAESNKKLMAEAKNNPDSYNIEVLSGKESEHIEMDLMLGVADLHTPEAVAAAESAIAGNPPAINLAETDDSSDDDDDDEEDEIPKQSMETEAKGSENGSCKLLKKQKSKKRSKIVELP